MPLVRVHRETHTMNFMAFEPSRLRCGWSPTRAAFTAFGFMALDLEGFEGHLQVSDVFPLFLSERAHPSQRRRCKSS